MPVLVRVDVGNRIQTPAVAPLVRGRRMETQVVQAVDGDIDAPIRMDFQDKLSRRLRKRWHTVTEGPKGVFLRAWG